MRGVAARSTATRALPWAVLLVGSSIATAGVAAGWTTTSPRLQGSCTPAPTQPCIWRDQWGVPHIEATCEADAWYALGYEEARDALFHVQCNLKSFTGRSAQYLGHKGASIHPAFSSSTVLNDFVVRAYDLDLDSLAAQLGPIAAEGYLKNILSEPGLADPDQVYKNLVAYAAGLDAYRQRLAGQVGLNPQEVETRRWILQRGDNWVLDDPINVYQVASYSGWLKAIVQFGFALLNDPSVKLGTCYQGQGSLDFDTLSKLSQDQQVAAILQGIAPAGSNGFAWSGSAHPFVVDGAGVSHSGVMADPHKGLDPTHTFKQKSSPGGPVDGGERATDFLAHVWNCHVIVPSTGLDVYGSMHHGSGTHFVFHNRNLGIGGSASNANIADTFMLRLQQQGPSGAGSPVEGSPKSFWSNYTNSWVALDPYQQQESIPVKGSTSPEVVNYWHIPAFGLAFCDMPFRTQHIAIPGAHSPWLPTQAGNILPPLMAETDPVPTGQIPVLFAARAPIDPLVDGARHFMRLSVGIHRMLHAANVVQVRDILATLDPSYVVNFTVVDRDGRLLATRAAAVPERGDDSQLPPGYNALLKYSLYDKLTDGEPVPACWPEDIVFDWRFNGTPGVTGNLRYLVPYAPGVPGAPFLPHVLHLPGGGGFPAQVPFTAPGVPYDNPGFATVSNEETFLQAHERIEYAPGSTALSPTGNGLLTAMVESKVLYHSFGLGVVALQKNQAIQASLKRTVSGPGAASMTIDEARRFVQDDRLHRVDDYPGYVDSAGSTQPGAPGVPTRVRAIAELVQHLTDIEAAANRDAKFLIDLYETLRSGQWSSVQLSGMSAPVDLGRVFLNNDLGGQPKVFKFDGAAPNWNYVEVPMPALFPLLDFYPREIRISGLRLGDRLQGGAVDLLNQAEFDRILQLRDVLVSWGAQDFEQRGANFAAALAGSLLQGLTARKPMQFPPEAQKFTLAHSWVPIVTLVGVRNAVTLPVGTNSLVSTFAQLAAAATFWDLSLFEGNLAQIGDLNAGLMRIYSDYQYLSHMLEPVDAWASLLGSAATPASGLNASTIDNPLLSSLYQDIPMEAFAALYVNGDPTQGIKPVGQLTEADVNALVDLLFALGGNSAVLTGGAGVTGKVAKVAGWVQSQFPGATPWPGHYPLTRSLVRMTILRRLLQADEQLEATQATAPKTWAARFVTRFFDFKGNKVWPTNADAAECVGASIRAVGFTGDTADQVDGSLQLKTESGLAPAYIGFGGTYSPLLALFPTDGGEPLSYSFVIPGERINAFGSPYLSRYSEAYATGEMPTTHYSDYRTHQSPVTDPGLPPSPYNVAVPVGVSCPQ